MSKLDNIGQHFPADGEFKSNKEFREAIMTWHNHIKLESKCQYTSVFICLAFFQRHRTNCTIWVWVLLNGILGKNARAILFGFHSTGLDVPECRITDAFTNAQRRVEYGQCQ